MKPIMTSIGDTSSRPSIRYPALLSILHACVAALTCALTTMLLVPAVGLLPGVELDRSWPYALAYAVANHFPFGRDVVFTFGPLASLYTGFFLPDQRLAFTLLKSIFVVTLCLVIVAMSERRTRLGALAVPLLIANFPLTDAVFLVAPLTIVPLTIVSWRNERLHTACLVAYASVLGPLALVKGTLVVPLAASLGCALLEVSRRSRRVGLALPCFTVASILVTWVALGQLVHDLPYFLMREAYVAVGYTDAMSLVGDPHEIWAFLGGATLLLASQVVPRRAPISLISASVVVLFVGFKAGFVRHDGHAVIAASTLSFLGLLIWLHRGNVASGFGLVASLVAWLAISANYQSIEPGAIWSQLTNALDSTSREIVQQVHDPDAFRRNFDTSKIDLAKAAELPPTSGSVDLYPNSQAILLASNRLYDPRPVMQSYSAYSSQLAFLNADHLAGSHAPETIFFGLDPIDGHYPAMEDGPSWPALLGQYRFRAFSRAYAVLDRVEGAQASTMDPPRLIGFRSFGEAIAVPHDSPFVWARMQFHPSLLGRVVSVLFKLPLITIAVATADGQIKTFRLVSGMADAGFLLSPTVVSARDFVALRSTDTDALAGQRVTSIVVHQEGGADLWGKNFDLQFAALRVQPDPRVDDLIMGHLDIGPAIDGLPESGQCMIDSVDGMPAATSPIGVTGRSISVTGWGLASTARGGLDGGNLRIALTQADGPTAYARAERQERPDVDAYFRLSKPTRAGFTARVNLSDIAGEATLRVVQDGLVGPTVCGPTITVSRKTVRSQ